LVCGVDVLTFYDFIPIRESYDNLKEEIENKKKQTIDKKGDIKDSLRLRLPVTKDRFQINHEGERIDIFEIINSLEEVYSRLNMDSGQHVPPPPSDREYLERVYVDMDLYRLLKKENIEVEEEGCLFCGQTIIFEPGETKRFRLDLSYLLLRRATYQIVFDCKTDNKLFRKETKFLKQLGFHRFKGRITSNVINVVSE
jgi:ferredoxin-like protein FixX